jgi:hypothetical protein
MWEIIKSDINNTLSENIDIVHSDRLWVPGGWIVRTIVKHAYSGASVHSSQMFVKDINHGWKL